MTDDTPIKRRLTAILAADIAGYSRLMGQDEAATVRDLKGHQEVVLPLVGKHGGRIIDTAGDGILAEFASVIDATTCAMHIQAAMEQRNQDVLQDRRMRFRMGVNLGDVIFDDNRIYGDGINVAARLESIADPGGILVSQAVYEQVRDRLEIEFDDLGARDLKNIARPVRVYRVRTPSQAVERELTGKAVFLSYASQDKQVALRLAESLRAVGIEVWLDQDELAGGDAWDRKIRQQIQSCALFVPVISPNTERRPEGYFRLEWWLAEQRSFRMAKGLPFLVPVVVDIPPGAQAQVPEAFNDVQWTRLDAGHSAEEFAARVKSLLAGSTVQAGAATPVPSDYMPPVVPQKRRSAILGLGALVLVLAIAGLGYRFFGPAAQDPATGEGAASVSEFDPASIAVLPLKNLSADPEQEYFASGMYDTLINSLCKVSALRVTSRTSASRMESGLTMPMIGRRLGVSKLLEGAVLREGNKVRVTLQLIDAATDKHLWAESYEREFTDVIGLQADVARAVARAVQVRLTEQDEQQLARSLVIQPPTFEAYLRAMFQFHKETIRGYQQGITILQEALENDPTSPLAYAGLAQGYAELGHSFYPVRGAYPKAKAAADKAIELDDTLAEAHLSVGMYKLYYEYDWDGAEAAFKRAMELNPSLSDAWYHWAWQLELFGRDEEAIAAGEKAAELSPLSPVWVSWLAEQYRDAGQVAKAIDVAESVLNLYPEFPVAWYVIGNAYVDQGRFDDAILAHEHLSEQPMFSWARGYSFAAAGQEDKAREIIAGIEHKQDNGLPLAVLYASVGDVEQALYWAEQVREIRMPWYPWLLGWFPQFKPLHDDPLIIEKARELGVPLLGQPT